MLTAAPLLPDFWNQGKTHGPEDVAPFARSLVYSGTRVQGRWLDPGLGVGLAHSQIWCMG